jgi:hypothetical protein
MKTFMMLSTLCFLAGLYVRLLFWFGGLGQLFW